MDQNRFSHSNPHLPVRNLRATLDYYRDKLGFTDEWTFGDTDGGLRRDEMRLLFGEGPDFLEEMNNERHRLPVMWFVENINGVYAEFQARGVEIAAPLMLHPYGLWEFAFIDINGYYIRVAEAE
jgi:catechol 2,3-dioxygenase-like lactoylglutathione lyase family enzyme